MVCEHQETEWDLALKKMGIVKDDGAEKVENHQEFSFQNNKAINDIFDSDEELEKIRTNRIKALKEYQKKAQFGSVIEITAAEYLSEVNRAGEEVWVILHLYQSNVEKCRQINTAMDVLASRYPHLKFIRSVSTKCVENYPNESLPSIFIYKNDNLIAQYIGPHNFKSSKVNFSEKDLRTILKRHKIIINDEDLSDSE